MTVTLPVWLALLLGLLLFWALFDRLLLPGARWFLRRRVNRVLEEINTRLKIGRASCRERVCELV